MKKINLSNIKDSLTKNELNKIMAGSLANGNLNTVQGCNCHSNPIVVVNDNIVTGCICDCL